MLGIFRQRDSLQDFIDCENAYYKQKDELRAAAAAQSLLDRLDRLEATVAEMREALEALLGEDRP